jgi:predicted nucleotidyltransferase
MPALRSATLLRLILARNISCSLEQDPRVLAVIATGSVVRNRCSRTSDLDVTVITADQGSRRSVTSERQQGVVIDIEWLTKRRAVSIMKGGRRDLKGLREASRLGHGIFLLDRESLQSSFRVLAFNLLPEKHVIDQRMAALMAILKKCSSQRPGPPEVQWEWCRALVDNLAFVLLLLHPFRYHKPKWVMADLRDAGYHSLNSLLRKAYRIGSDSSNTSCRSIELSRQFIEGMGQLMKTPSIEHMLKKGFTRKYAAWSYLCRTWEDAESLFQDQAFGEANFTAKFAVRMTFPLYLEKFEPDNQSTNPLVILKKIGDDRLSKIYQKLFPVPANLSYLDQHMLRESLYLVKTCWEIKQQTYGENG